MTDDNRRNEEMAVENRADRSGHWPLFRDLFFFQIKLLLDGLRDILLSPVSIVAALFGLIRKPDNPGHYFHKLLALGHRSDQWINLFGTDDAKENRQNRKYADAYLDKIEQRIRQEYEKEGLLRDVKERIDQVLSRPDAEQSANGAEYKRIVNDSDGNDSADVSSKVPEDKNVK